MPDLDMLGAATLWPLVEMAFDAGSRRFWAYWLAAALLCALLLHRARRGDSALAASVRALWARETWLHPSARVDYALMLLNGAVLLVILGAFTLSHVGIATAIGDAAAQWGWTGLDIVLPAWLAGGIVTLALFLVDDFGHFFAHYLQHRVPFLWASHKVHHSAEVLNPFTAERMHPLDTLFVTVLRLLLTGAAMAALALAFAGSLTPWTIAGANVLLFAFNLAGGLLRHSPVWLDYGPRWDRLFISPAMHQIHHSADVRHWDRNMGGTLSLWDAWFGTRYIPQQQEALRFGLGGAEQTRYRSLLVCYLRPLAEMAGLLWRGVSFRPAPGSDRDRAAGRNA